MRLAVIGLGSIGRRHAGNALAMGHVVVGFDPAPPRQPEPWPRADTLEAACEQAEAVLVCTPTSLHAEHALRVLDHGCPVLVEKPLAAHPDDAARVEAAARAGGIACGVSMNLRFHPGVRVLRDLLERGRLGAVQLARVSCGSDLRAWRPGTDYRQSYSARAELGGGVVRDCIHELDYLTWLLGPARSVMAEAGHVSKLEIDVEDVALALLRLHSGALATVDLTYLDPVYRRGCLLVGETATAHWDWTRATVEVARPGAEIETIDASGDVADTYRAVLADFLAAVEQGREPRTTAAEGVAAVGLADALLRSAGEGRRITL